MTPNRPHGNSEEQNDNRLSRMVAVSAVLHLVVITTIVITATRSRLGQAPPMAYTVALIDPAALGTNLPPSGGKPSPTEESRGGEKPVPPRPQPAPEVKEPPAAKKEEPKVTPPSQAKEKEVVKLPDKDKPVEKPPPKPEPEKAKVEEKKPEPAKTEPPSPSAEERDQEIAKAIEKIRGKIQPKEKDSPVTQPSSSPSPVNGSGPTALGGAPDQGGGGLMQGLEFIMYTEQVKRRVKESWIVTEKKPGLSATVRFGVQPDGAVVAIELVRRSGDRAFDESVVRAVNKANPLPPPPPAYQQAFATQKVEVTFGGEEHTN